MGTRPSLSIPASQVRQKQVQVPLRLIQEGTPEPVLLNPIPHRFCLPKDTTQQEGAGNMIFCSGPAYISSLVTAP